MAQDKKEWEKKIGVVTFHFTQVNDDVYVIVDCKSSGCFDDSMLSTETLDQFQQRMIQKAYQWLQSDARSFKRIAEEQAFIVKDKVESGWRPIEELNVKKKSIYGYPYLLFSKELIDEDFNPSGVCDGFYQDGEGWVGGVWDNDQDCYRVVSIKPTHYKEKRGPSV